MGEHVWKNIVEESHEPILIIEKKSGKIRYANKAAIKLFPQLVPFIKADILFYELNEFSLHSTNGFVFEKISKLNEGESERISIEIKGKPYYLSIKIENDGNLLVVRLLSDESVMIVNNDGGLSCDYRDILNSMIEGVNSVPYHEYDELLSNSLAQIGAYFQCERAYIFNYSDDERFVSMAQQWTKEGVVPFSSWKDIPLVHFNHVGGHLLNNKVYCINELADIPDAAIAERNGMMAEGVKSVLLVSFKSKKHTLGFVGIDMVSSERHWTSDEVEMLSFYTAFVANIQVKQKDYLHKSFQEAVSSRLYEESTWAIGIFKDSKLVDCNNQALALLKGKKHELVGRSVFDLTYAEDNDRNRVERKMLDFVKRSKKGEIITSLWDVLAIDGSVEKMELTFQGFDFDDKTYLAISAKDVKKQIEKEQELIESEKNLKSKLETILSPSKKISKVNLLDLLNKEQLYELATAFSEATGLASVIMDNNGQEISSITTTNEICDLIRSTAKGKEVCQMSDMILNTRIKDSLKPEWHQCLSCSFLDAAAPIIVDGELVGTWWIGRALTHDADIKRVIKFGTQLGINENYLGTAFGKQKRIGKREFEKALHLLRVLANELSNLAYNNLKLAKALKSHQRLEKRLEKAKLKAEESDKLKSAFLANMSHEIRTPMNGIIGFSELIKSPEIEVKDRDNYISIIQESSNQLLNIINDIIDISKIEAGQIEANCAKFHLLDLMNELVLFYGSIADQKKIKLILHYPVDRNLEIFGDRIKLKQVFSNLIGNAIKFTNDGYVRFGCLSIDSDHIKFYVEDTGIGVSSSDQKQIFNRFWQVGKRSSNTGGTGLGLTITKAYVELMGGEISLESELKEGTVFRFSLPFNNIVPDK